MRVLALASSYPKVRGDGTAPFIERITRATARLGCEVDLVLPAHPELRLEGREDGLPIRFHTHWSGPGDRPLWGYASSMQADRALRRSALLLAPFVALAAERVLRRVARDRKPDLIHAHWVLPNGAIAARVARSLGRPLVLSLHGSDVFVAEGNAVLARAARYAFDRAAAVTACSGDLATRAEALGAREVVRLPYGVDAEEVRGDREAGRRRLGVGEADFVVLGLGRLVAKKGFDVLIRAVAALGSGVGEGAPVLVLAGDGDLRSDLAAEAERCGVALRLIGEVAHDAVGDCYAAADVVAVPSVRGADGNVDGLPNVLLEALAAGRPVVASDVAGIPEVVRDGENGLLVPPGDVVTLAASLGALRANAIHRTGLGSRAAADAAGRGWGPYGERLLALYGQATEPRL